MKNIFKIIKENQFPESCIIKEEIEFFYNTKWGLLHREAKKLLNDLTANYGFKPRTITEWLFMKGISFKSNFFLILKSGEKFDYEKDSYNLLLKNNNTFSFVSKEEFDKLEQYKFMDFNKYFNLEYREGFIEPFLVRIKNE